MSTENAPFHPGIAGHPSVHATARRRRAAGPVDLAKLAEQNGEQPLTLRELAERYRARYPDRAVILLAAKKWLDDFGLGDKLAWTITRAQIQAGAKYMREHGYGVATVNRNLSLIGSLYRLAIADEVCPIGFVSPTFGLRREKEEMRIVEPAKPGEWDRFRSLARGKCQRFTLFVWLIMDTGCRRAEIRDRTWNEFEIDDPAQKPCLVLPASLTKTGVARRVYFSHETAALLRRIRPAEKYRGGLVFTSHRTVDRPNEYRKPWARLTARCGRPGMHLHDLRHMVAAQFLKAREGLAQTAHALGNSAEVLEKRYGHLDDATTEDMQTRRLGLDAYAPPPELGAVVEARARQAERAAAAPSETEREIARLMLIAQDAMTAVAAAQAAIAASRGAQ